MQEYGFRIDSQLPLSLYTTRVPIEQLCQELVSHTSSLEHPTVAYVVSNIPPFAPGLRVATDINKQTNKNLRCGNRKGLLGRNDQTHHRMGPKTMDSTPPIKRNTQADIQLQRLQTVRIKQITRRIYLSPRQTHKSLAGVPIENQQRFGMPTPGAPARSMQKPRPLVHWLQHPIHPNACMLKTSWRTYV